MSQTKLSTEEIDSTLADLKGQGKNILECIVYFRQTFGFDLSECKDIVLNSKAWVIERAAFIRNHEEVELEFLKACANDENIKRSFFYKFYKFFVRSK